MSLLFTAFLWMCIVSSQSGTAFQFPNSKHPSNSAISSSTVQRCAVRNSSACDKQTLSLKAGKKDDEFWIRQRAVMEEMTGNAEKAFQQEQREKFAQRRKALIVDTALFTVLIFSGLWAFSANPFVPISYGLGSMFGLLYTYGLGRYVETIGGSVNDTEMVQGAGIGQARFAFLILLFLFVGKFRSQGLVEIPSIIGFFTYQLASLNQGLREIDD